MVDFLHTQKDFATFETDAAQRLFAPVLSTFKETLQEHALEKAQHVLDLPCGSGLWTQCLDRILSPKAYLSSVDDRRAPLHLLHQRPLQREHHFIRKAQFEELPFREGVLDIIVSMWVQRWPIPELIHSDRMLHTFMGWLKPDALLFLLLPEPDTFAEVLHALTQWLETHHSKQPLSADTGLLQQAMESALQHWENRKQTPAWEALINTHGGRLIEREPIELEMHIRGRLGQDRLLAYHLGEHWSGLTHGPMLDALAELALPPIESALRYSLYTVKKTAA